MPKPAGRPVDRDKDRLILATARDILFEHGPQAVTMEAVAAQSGVSKATLYTRHSDRDQLLRAVVAAESFVFTQALESPAQNVDDFTRALTTLITSLATFLISTRHLRLMQVISSPTHTTTGAKRELYRNGPQKTHDALSAYLESAATRGLIYCDKPVQSAELLIGMMMGLDLIRASYGLMPRTKPRDKLKQHAQFIAQSFLAIHEHKD